MKERFYTYIMNINFKKLYEDANTPTYGTIYSAGLDLYAYLNQDSQNIPRGTTEKIGTGICMEIPDGYVGLVFARSGVATKRGLRPANCVGVIDSDYRGEIIVALHNDSDKCEAVHQGERIAQLVIVPYLTANLIEQDNLQDTTRGKGGFGSTGVK